MRTILDALRLVPGVDANKFAVSVRGLNARAAQHLLAMIDVRSNYDPLFTGVLWEAQDVLLDDIERTEVVRVPGNTL